MSLYQDEHGYEKNPSPVSPVMTEIVGGALDAYYSRIRHMEQEIESLRYDKRSAESRLEFAESKVEENWTSREEQAKRADNAEGKARVLQSQLNSKVTEMAKQEKVIEQYAAWRVAVREAINDLPSAYTADESVLAILSRIVDLTNTMEEETS